MAKSSSASEFIRFAGDMAASFSFSRSIGQIYALLYIADEPLSLSDISEQLSMSKGNASINLRTLESWDAIRPIAVPGSRRDHYEADRDLKKVFLRRLNDGLGRRLDRAEGDLERLLNDMENDRQPDHEHARVRLEELRAHIQRGRRVLVVAPKLLSLVLK